MGEAEAAEATGPEVGQLCCLFRAVKTPEIEDLLETDRFRNPYGIEVKYFALAVEHAALYGGRAQAIFGDPPYQVVKAVVDCKWLGCLPRFVVDEIIESVVLSTADLANLGPPEFVMNPD